MRTRVLRRPIVFLRVRCNICVRCSILILLRKTVRCRIVRFSIPDCRLHVYVQSARAHVDCNTEDMKARRARRFVAPTRQWRAVHNVRMSEGPYSEINRPCPVLWLYASTVTDELTKCMKRVIQGQPVITPRLEATTSRIRSTQHAF